MKNLLFFLITIAAIFTSTNALFAQSTLGPFIPDLITINAGGTQAWSNPSNILYSDDVYMKIDNNNFDDGDYSDTLVLTDFGIPLPTQAIILGIMVKIERKKKGRGKRIRDAIVQLIDTNGILIGDNKAITGVNWPGKETVQEYGANSDLWNTTLTAAELLSPKFGMMFQVKSAKNDSKAWVDRISISVTYTVPGIPDGPGGIGSSNGSAGLVGWYKPSLLRNSNNDTLLDGETVEIWFDVSGYGNNLTLNGNQVTYESDGASLVNGYPAFTATNLSKKCFTAGNVSAKTIIAVCKPNTGAQQLAGIDGVGINTAATSTDWDFNNGNGWDGNVGEGHSYINGSIGDTGTHNNDLHLITQSRPTSLSNILYLGGYSGTNKYSGTILEVMVFDVELSLAEKIIIDNYLSAKYFVNLVANDLFTADDPIAGDFDYHVAGIGMAPDSSGNDAARGSGIITIDNATSMDPDDYLFWGENLENSNHDFNTAWDYMERNISTWRVTKSNDLGKVTVSVDADDLILTNMKPCATLYLILSPDSAFLKKTYYTPTLTAGTYVMDSVEFTDGDYFTYEYQDLIAIDSTRTYSQNDTDYIVSTSDDCFKLLITATADGREVIGTNCKFREVEIEAGGVTAIDTGIFMTVEGDIINNGTLIVQEGASIIQNSVGVDNNSGTGNYIVQRTGDTSSYVYNIWSSPIQAADIPTVFSNANPCDIWTFDETTQAWKADYAIGHTDSCYGNPVSFIAFDVIPGGDGIMDVARGYYVPGDTTATKVYDGQVNNGDLTFDVTTTALGNPGSTSWGGDDWNLLGNPYPSGLNSDAFWTANAANISDALYFWDAADTIDGYNENTDYASWNNTGAVESGNSTKLPDGNIGSGQGFWVVAANTTNLSFDNSMRSDTNSQFFKTSNKHNQHNAWFKLTSPSAFVNNILVGFNPATTDSLDSGYDAHKLVGNNNIKFTSLMNNEEFVIQSLSMVDKGAKKVLGLVVYSAETGMHTFKEYRRENMDIDLKVYLRDNILGVDHDLSLGDYQVNLNANLEYRTRFELVFSNEIEIASGSKGAKGDPTKDNSSTPETANSVKEIQSEGFTYTQDQNQITLTNHDGVSGTVYLTDITGKRLITKRLNANSTQISIEWAPLAQGSYFVTIHNNDTILFNKQVIKH